MRRFLNHIELFPIEIEAGIMAKPAPQIQDRRESLPSGSGNDRAACIFSRFEPFFFVRQRRMHDSEPTTLSPPEREILLDVARRSIRHGLDVGTALRVRADEMSNNIGCTQRWQGSIGCRGRHYGQG